MFDEAVHSHQPCASYTNGVSLSSLYQARAGIEELHFFPFNPVDKRTQITYIDKSDNKMYRASKGAPEQVCFGCHNFYGAFKYVSLCGVGDTKMYSFVRRF